MDRIKGVERRAARKKRLKKKLLDVLDLVPEFKAILLRPASAGEKRRLLRSYLSRVQTETFRDKPDIPPLEWILARDALTVLRGILTKRSERLAGFSLLKYLGDLLARDIPEDLEEPSPGFIAELEHLLRGISGQAGIYSSRLPAFVRYHGRKAARLRSEDLSRMARVARRYMERYPNGLDEETRRRRRLNRERILRRLGASESDWGDWRWQARNVVRGEERLESLVEVTREEREGVRLAREHGVPFGVTPYYLSLFDERPDGGRDVAIRAQVLPSPHYVRKMKEFRDCEQTSMDFMLERDTSPVEGVTRRYPMIVILKPFLTCPQICVYCQRNWEIEDVRSSSAALSEAKLEKAIRWIEGTPEISEVLVTGGDPLMLSDERIERLLDRLSRNPNIERIRVGTRTPATLPQRITEDLAGILGRFHVPGRREVLVVTHFESAYEITPEAVEAVQRLRRRGMEVCNQLVYTFYNSRCFEAANLRHRLRLAGVTPYYTFNTKGKEETDDFRVPLARLLQEQKEEARLMPGTVRTDEVVFNVPGLGKNYVRARQHHDVISILPSGRRVYEFHPWEKKLALVDTYVYTDVSIHDYLRRLRRAGENVNDYRTIWYYY